MVEKLKNLYAQIKAAHVNMGSLLLIKSILAISIVPVVLYIILWIIVACGYGHDKNLALLQEIRLFIGTVFAPQVVAGVLAYCTALIDKNKNGESDELENKAEESGNHDKNMY